MDNLDLFAIEKGELTMVEAEPFRIGLEDTHPYADKFLWHKPNLACFIDKEVGSLLNRELIYPSSSPWATKVVLAPKED